MSKAVSIILIIVFFALGFAGGYFFADSQNKAKLTKLQQEFSQFKKNVDSFFPAPPKEVKSMTGVVKSVDQSSILVSIPVLSQSRYPWEQREEKAKSRDIILRVGKDTKIVKREFVQPSKENDFNPFKEVEISISELKKGDIVSFTSDQNILDRKDVLAKKITLNFQQPETPEVLPAQSTPLDEGNPIKTNTR